jgi:tetratricopeptide (TPR) repeat protein
MRIMVVAVALLGASAAQAQMGKRVVLQAGSPEDKALQEISAAADPAKKLELLDKFVSEFEQADVVLLAYEMYVTHYAAEKNYARAFEFGEKLLARDPDNFNGAFALLRAAQEQADLARLFQYGEAIAGIVARFTALAAPEGEDPAVWATRKAATLADAADNVNYAQYTLFSAAYQAKDPLAKAQYLERFIAAFPESQFASVAATVTADAYRQARQPAKMVEFAERVLQRDPSHIGLLVLLADYWTESKEELDKAEQYAAKALGLLAPASAPANMTPEQWAQQKALQEGLARSAVGQVHMHKNRDAQAVEAFKAAAPLLKPYNFYYGRTLYHLGFVLGRMKRVAEARPVLQEAVAVDSPYRSLAQESLAKLAAPAKAARKRP